MSLPLSLALVGASASRAEVDPYRYVDLTLPQEEFYLDPEPESLWRDGNQLGKSFALAFLVLMIVLKLHPTIKLRGRVQVLVLSVSYEQMVPLMEKLWELSPKHVPGRRVRRGDPPRLVPSAGFEPGRGVVGKPPRLVFTDGSQIVFGTYKQGATRIAGGTYDMVVMDEPPTESMYGEVQPRLMRRRGILRVTMTPTPDMPDQGWYRERVERGRVSEHNHGLSEEILRPRGYPAPWLWQDEIDAYAETLLDVEREMRIRGAWEPLVTGRWLRAFVKATHVQAQRLSTLRGWTLTVGLDHGTVEGKQTAALIATTGGHTSRPKVRQLAEHVSEGVTTPEHDAEAVLEMLDSAGLTYRDVDLWVGDVPTGSKRWDVRKSNRILRRELARILGVRLREIKPIPAPKKHAGSLTYGMRLVNTLMAREGAWETDPSCVHSIEAFGAFAGDSRDPVKDVLDAVRYAVERACTGRVMPVLTARY